MSDTKIACPHCDQRILVPNDLFGQTISCPTCARSIQLPELVSVSADSEIRDNDNSIAQVDHTKAAPSSTPTSATARREVDDEEPSDTAGGFWLGLAGLFLGGLICAWQIYEVHHTDHLTIWVVWFLPIPVIVLGILLGLGGLAFLFLSLISSSSIRRERHRKSPRTTAYIESTTRGMTTAARVSLYAITIALCIRLVRSCEGQDAVEWIIWFVSLTFVLSLIWKGVTGMEELLSLSDWGEDSPTGEGIFRVTYWLIATLSCVAQLATVHPDISKAHLLWVWPALLLVILISDDIIRPLADRFVRALRQANGS